MTPEVWTYVVSPFVAAFVAVCVLWVKRKLRLSDEAKDAVSSGGLRPKDADEAFIALAHKVNEQGTQLGHLRSWVPQVVRWGERGWQQVEPVEAREPMPAPPEGLYL